MHRFLEQLRLDLATVLVCLYRLRALFFSFLEIIMSLIIIEWGFGIKISSEAQKV